MAEPSVEPRTEGTARAVTPIRELSHLPLSAAPKNHGRTIAAWTTVLVVVVGAIVSAVSTIFAIVPLVWTGAAVIVLGLVTGKVLQILGYGQGGSATLARQARSRR